MQTNGIHVFIMSVVFCDYWLQCTQNNK